MKIKQSQIEVAEDVRKPKHLTIGPLAYHTMTAVFEPIISR